MLDSEPNNHETDIDKATGHSAGDAPAPVTPAVPAALFQPPQVLFQPPVPVAPPARDPGASDPGDRDGRPEADGESGRTNRRTRSRNRRGRDSGQDDDLFAGESADAAGAIAEADATDAGEAAVAESDEGEESAGGRRRRRRTRTRGRAEPAADDDGHGRTDSGDTDADADGDEARAEASGDASAEGDDDGEPGASGRRRRRKRRRGLGDADAPSPDDPPDTVVHVREPHNAADDVRAIKGSTRLEAKKQRRREGRESGRRRPPVITESEFLARRESVDRAMVVRQRGDRTQIAVLEDGVLVEHYVNRTTHASYVGNVYLGKVQNVLPSMEAAFVDIGKGRNAVLYAGEVNFDASGLEGQPKRIESALKPGQSVIVQVTKDPVGHKGARLTSQVSLPGRYLVYVPGASMTGISRKLPDTERTRLKQILKKVTPENAGVIVRTAAEGAAEAELDRDITRLAAQWESIEKKAKTATAPALLYGEPDLTIRVIRDVFNEDFNKLIVSGDDGWETIDEYVRYVAPHLADRISRWDAADDETVPSQDGAGKDVFAAYRVDEQLAKALDRKVWLPSGGSLVIDRTEAMTVIDVNTGKFTGQGGNLEETVTRNNLEAAEEIVRQLRLRDVGGIVVIDFIDMVLESNRELVLRRLLECLARDRTKHQVAEVTSLGLVQMTRKRVGAGLLEAFSQPCECCNGRGVIITLDAPAEPAHRASAGAIHRPVPAPPPGAPANGNGFAGTRSSDTRAGSGNGRRNRRDEERAASGDFPAAAPAGAGAEPETSADLERVDAATSAVDDNGTGNDTGTQTDASGGRRTRRSTSAGTAFATAVLVDDTPPLVHVVPTVPSVTDPASSGAAPAVPGTGVTESAEPPARRTRAGSAVARVTVVTEPEPPAPPEPAPEPEPEPEPALAFRSASETVAAPADTAIAVAEPESLSAEASPAAVEPDTAPAEPAVATGETAEAVPVDAEPPIVTESAVDAESPVVTESAVDAEPPIVTEALADEAALPADEPLPLFPAAAAEPAADLEAPTADALEQATKVPAEPEPVASFSEPSLVSASLFEVPPTEAAPAPQVVKPAEETVAALTADAAGEPALEASTQEEAAYWGTEDTHATEVFPAAEEDAEAVAPDAEDIPGA